MTKQPLVSVVLGTYNSAAFLEALLNSVKNQTYKNIELIVVDNNSSDNTLDIAEKLADKVFTKGPERSAQRNHGVWESSGEILIVLDSDMLLTEKVVEEVVAQFSQHPEQKALVIPEESFGEGFWTQCKKLERSFYVGVDWMEAARAFKRDVFEQMKGYDEDNTGTEDYDLPHRIENKYGKESIGRINAMILHNEGKLEFFRTCKKKYYYAQALDVYVKKPENETYFKKQANPLNRFGLYFSSPLKLLKNPLVGMGMLFLKSSEMLAGILGYLTRKSASKNNNVKNSIYK